ncbi:RNA polymerase sigma factor [Dysgonomonas massiliensis]|uniref:RNA polymerase sigma factor n=1 Tax=Dysgonomonas massiliensis TaxID=2040292 RepID=UPI000C7843D2|nr:RNA polymerase sigma factor [Dysgonomonas massiliensis]
MDAETFKQVFLPHHQKLYRIAFRIVQNQVYAEDIVQETYIKLWEKRKDLDDINNAEAFSIIVLRNNCLDFLRSSKDGITQELIPDSTTSDVSMIESIEIKDKASIVKSIINQLPEQQKQILQFKDCDGYTHEEIEMITGLNAVNIRVILSRARKSVRDSYYSKYKE